MRRIPSLDGLRAISITLVLLGHAAGTRYCFDEMWLRHFGDTASLGVRTFFIISGYLISKLLIREKEISGTISLKNFYMRRILRIFPAFYFFLIVILVCRAIHAIVLLPGDVIHALSYTMNYHYYRSWWVGHIWSLSVEEQFYLLWPALLLLCGLRRGMACAAAMVFIAPALRVVLFHYFGERSEESFPVVADTIAIGCLLAWRESTLKNADWFRFLSSSNWFFLLPLGIGILNVKAGGTLRMACLDTVINVGIAIVIARIVENPTDVLGRVLNSPPLAFAGAVSYSLYLWQQPFINRYSSSWISMFPLNVLLAFSCALLSRVLIEKPFLRLKTKIDDATASSLLKNGASLQL